MYEYVLLCKYMQEYFKEALSRGDCVLSKRVYFVPKKKKNMMPRMGDLFLHWWLGRN